MVFAPCRPRYANDLINLSDAFVGAWLPGSEGKGVADVLFAGVDGKPAHDFSGTLSFAWPGVACPGPRAEGPDGAAPLFALGYGLSYATPGDVAALPDRKGVGQGNRGEVGVRHRSCRSTQNHKKARK